MDTIINGHTPANTTWADLKEFADFNHDFLTWAQGELKAAEYDYGEPEHQQADVGHRKLGVDDPALRRDRAGPCAKRSNIR